MRNRETYNAYHKSYQLARYHRRRAQAIQDLGGRCVHCGTTTQLEIDHINPEDKEIRLNKLWGIAEKRFQQELRKCQLLCHDCHVTKTSQERAAVV